MTTTNHNSADAAGAKQRKTLAGQIDRLDGILDGLSDGLNEAVADAVREGVQVAVKEAVQTVMAELLSNPEVLALLRGGLHSAAPAQPAPECASQFKDKFVEKTRVAGSAFRNRWLALRGWAAQVTAKVWAGATCLWERGLGLAQVRVPLLAALGVGLATGTLVHLAGPCLGALLSGALGFTGALAVQAWWWLYRRVEALGLLR